MARQPTQREIYAPIIAAEIQRLKGENPKMPWKAVRRELGKINPGPWQHQKRTWSSECTRQVQFWTRFNEEPPYIHRVNKPRKQPPDNQGKLF